ncbi:MAG: hypothetical protein LUC90_10255 [Lachnospiraceae bacterium]|nr:hypothetical protein [Lachnospiraceae bacterium]
MEEIYKDLQLDHWEMTAANAMLLYLHQLDDDAARKIVRPIVDVNMYSIEGSTAQTVQNVIDDTKLAEVIDLAIGFAAEIFESGWNAEDQPSTQMKNAVVTTLSSIKGSTIVQNMSTDFAEFVIRCGRWVWTLQ